MIKTKRYMLEFTDIKINLKIPVLQLNLIYVNILVARKTNIGVIRSRMLLQIPVK